MIRGSTRQTEVVLEEASSVHRQDIVLQQFEGFRPPLEKAKIEQQSFVSKVMKWKTLPPSSVSMSSSRVKDRFFNRSVKTLPSLNLPAPQMPLSEYSLNSHDLIVVARPFPSDFQLMTEIRCQLSNNSGTLTRQQLFDELQLIFECDLTSKLEFINLELAKFLK